MKTDSNEGWVWMTDLHLNFNINQGVKRKFLKSIETCGKPILITGDISDGRRLYSNLTEILNASAYPVYAISGNHDYYHSNFKRTRSIFEQCVTENQNFIYLPQNGIVDVGNETCLIGPESWYDGKVVSNLYNTPFGMNDFILIEDLDLMDKSKIVSVFQKRASDALVVLKKQLETAILKYKRIIIMSHPVPFGVMDHFKDSELKPFYIWYEAGAYISDFCFLHPEIDVLWLSGHTHGRGSFENNNLKAYSLEAEYGYPCIGAKVSSKLEVTYIKKEIKDGHSL